MSERHYKNCDFDLSFIDDGSMSMYEKMCYLITVMKDLYDTVEGFDNDLSLKEYSANITNLRKLSESGNFTGTLMGVAINTILQEIDSNSDTLEYLTNQFADGQTGFVIDGGFFEETGIARNFNGGVF